MGDEEKEQKRRETDIQFPARSINCDQHEAKIDDINGTIHQSKGWAKAAAGFWGVAIVVLGALGSNMNSKLDNIENMLSNDKSDIRLLNEQMKNLQTDVKEIQGRHTFQDQEKYRAK
jgi:hypothetical protein